MVEFWGQHVHLGTDYVFFLTNRWNSGTKMTKRCIRAGIMILEADISSISMVTKSTL